jgi:tRNA dimethylallyltransferase
VDDFHFFPLESRDQVRQKWETVCQEKGQAFLFQELRRVDPVYAEKVGANDRKRIIRALEVWELTGEPFPVCRGKTSTAIKCKSLACMWNGKCFITASKPAWTR